MVMMATAHQHIKDGEKNETHRMACVVNKKG